MSFRRRVVMGLITGVLSFSVAWGMLDFGYTRLVVKPAEERLA